MLPILRGMTKGGTSRSGQRNRYVAPVAFLVMMILIGQVFWVSENRHRFAPFAINRVTCPYCAKNGTVRDPDDQRIMKMCPVCFGVGFHTVRHFDEKDVLCAACGGMGRLEKDGTWRTCRRCDGRGVHRIDDWQRTVPLEAVPTEP